jgi:threonine dehydratase
LFLPYIYSLDFLQLDSMPSHLDLNPQSIGATERLIRPFIRRTPILEVAGADFGLATESFILKLELFQHAGSFKSRGAFTHLLSRPMAAAGVSAASGGNHGVAVAFAAKTLGASAHIFVPSVASPAKVERIKSLGAQLTIAGDRYADALDACGAWSKASGANAVHAYDQIETLLGQATLGLELEEQEPEIDTLLVAVGGGGLIGGIAAHFRSRITAKTIKLIGVEPQSAPTLTHALRAGKPVDSPAGGIAADSLAPKRVGELMFPLAQDLVDRVILVTDAEIQAAQRSLWETTRIASEPGGAAAFAALLCGRYKAAPGERVAVIICGGNTADVRL